MRTCTKCSRILTLDRFYTRKSHGDGMYRHCKDCHRAITTAWLNKSPQRRRDIAKAWRRKLRARVLIKVSGSTLPACACCGETQIEFLTIDHINGGGRRESLSYGSHVAFLADIVSGKRRKDDLQILCWNCNMAKGGRSGWVCPHKRLPEKAGRRCV